MCIAYSDHTHRRIAGWLLMLLAASGMFISASAPVYAAQERRQQTAEFYCANASGRPVVCKSITTGSSGTVTIQVTNHAKGGEVCYLARPQNDNKPNMRPGCITSDLYIDEGDNRPHTISGSLPAGTAFDLRCMRRANRGDAGIGGIVYYR